MELDTQSVKIDNSKSIVLLVVEMIPDFDFQWGSAAVCRIPFAHGGVLISVCCLRHGETSQI